MSTSQITYNPGILGDDALVRSFVVRQQLLDLILGALRENATSSTTNRHLLMIGPRGIGKTMLVRRAAAEIRLNPEYSLKWYPLVFGEESYPVSTPGEFWLEALFHLADQTGNLQLQKILEELRVEPNDSRLRANALGQLLDFANRQGKRIVLVVENLNTLIGEQLDSDSARDLRRTIINERRLMLLGTATNRFDETENGGQALFEMFAVHQLQPLTPEECGELWKSITGHSLSPNPLKAVRILTGGNPRLITVLGGFAAHNSFRQLMEQLVHLIDDHTEYFRGHLDSLGVKERRVFVALLEKWDPVSAAELARQTRLGVNEVSALLGRLTARGAVEVAHQKGRKKLYQASERLYNIYYLMRRRGHPEGRVQAAVQFMISFYEREELVTQLADLAREACGLPEETRRDHYYAYKSVLRKMHGIAPLVVERTRREFFQFPDATQARQEAVLGLLEEAHSLYHQGNLQDSEKLYRRALELDDKNVAAWNGLAGVLYDDRTRIHEAEQAIYQAVTLSPDPDLWHNLGLTLAGQGRLPEAEEAFSKEVELESDKAARSNRLGNIHFVLGRLQEAERAYRKAIELAPGASSYWNDLAFVLHSLGHKKQVVEALRRAVELNPDEPDYWSALGHRLLETGPPDEAERVWSEALKRHASKIPACFVHLLELRVARGVSHASILEAAEDWVSRYHSSTRTLTSMAEFVVRLKLVDGLRKAERWAREAFVRQQNEHTAQALALVLSEMGMWKEAIESSRAMLDSCKDDDEDRRDITTELLIRAAAAGWAKEALRILTESKGAAALEPLAVGLQIYLGETPIVAKEILEVGQDVAERIRLYATRGAEKADNDVSVKQKGAP